MIYLLDTSAASALMAKLRPVVERLETLAENDLWIAAVARSLDAVLVAADKDFRRLEDLTVEDWTREDDPGLP